MASEVCVPCGQQFQDWVSYIRHKVTSGKHPHACPICGQEFQSEEGKQSHRRQAHPTDQELKCNGCGHIFTRCGSLVQHIEIDGCPGFRKQAFDKLRDANDGYYAPKKNITGATTPGTTGMCERAYAVPVSPEVTKASPAPASPVQAEIDKASASLASLAQPEVDLMSDFEPYTKESEHEVLNLKFPALKIQKNGLCLTDNTAKLKRPTDMDSLTEKELDIDLIQTSPPKSPLKVSGPAQKSESIMAKPAAQYYHKHDPDQPGFNLEHFRNPYSKKYKCAFAGCTKLLNSSQALYMHLKSNAHLTELSTCPTCLNQFNSGAALMQHLESQTNRCNARDGRHFRQLIDQVAAGMVDTAGTHDDNTHKFYSARIVPKLALDTVHEAKDEIVINAVNDPEYRADRVREREQKLQEEKDRLDEWQNEDWAD